MSVHKLRKFYSEIGVSTFYTEIDVNTLAQDILERDRCQYISSGHSTER